MINCDDLSGVTLAELVAAGNWQQQYRLIIQWGKLIQSKPELRQPVNLIKGCELPVWLAHELQGNQHYFTFDSDSHVMNGLVVLLLLQLNGKTSAQICPEALTQTLRDLGLEKHLTPSRNNGFSRIIERALTQVG